MADEKKNSTTLEHAAPIRADDETTWPAPVLEHLQKHLPLFRSYQEHHNKYVKAQVESHPDRHSFGPHPEARLRELVLGQLDRILAPYKLVGYHCTRLLDSEIGHIMKDGMTLLSAGHIDRKLERAAASGLSPAKVARLLKNAQLKEKWGRRLGMIWFVFTRASLSEEGGLWRFFEFWGGEAIYVRWSEHPYCEVGQALRALGQPCIVEAAVPIKHLQVMGIGDRLCTRFLANRGLKTEPVDFEGWSERAIARADILRVVRRGDPDFQAYTKCDSWQEPLR